MCDGQTKLTEMLLTLGYTDQDIKALELSVNCRGQTQFWYSCKINTKNSSEYVIKDLFLCDECLKISRNTVLTTWCSYP